MSINLILHSLFRATHVLACLTLLCSAAHAQTTNKDEVMIYAAASLRDVLPVMFKAAPPALAQQVRFTFAASSTLAQQLERGDGKAQLFISADEEWMQHVAKSKHVDPATIKSIAANRLVLIAPANAAPFSEAALRANATQGGTKGRVQAHVKLALTDEKAKLAIADPDHVPAGKYAKVALQALNVWGLAAPRLAPAPDARAALAIVVSGEVPLGIVYATDALSTPQVRMVAQVPIELHPPVFYYAALTPNASTASKQALEFLSSDAAKNVLLEFGFRPL